MLMEYDVVTTGFIVASMLMLQYPQEKALSYNSFCCC